MITVPCGLAALAVDQTLIDLTVASTYYLLLATCYLPLTTYYLLLISLGSSAVDQTLIDLTIPLGGGVEFGLMIHPLIWIKGRSIAPKHKRLQSPSFPSKMIL